MNKNIELVVANRKLPRERNLPDLHHSQSSNDIFYHNHPKTFYCQLYFKTFGNILNYIKDRLNQKDYQIYVCLQEIVHVYLKVFKEQDSENDLQLVIQKYDANEHDVPSLKT